MTEGSQPERAMERGAIAGLFHTFANAVLARTLPSVREWLRQKVGERATIASMELDGARVHLIDARLPLGPTAVLEIERATFATSAGDLAAGRPPMRMESMRGRLTVPDEAGGLRFEAPLTFEGEPPRTGLEWVHGRVTVEGARWAASMGRDAQAPIDGTIRVSVTSSDWALEGGEAKAGDATLWIDAAGRLDDDARAVERARLRTDDARVGHYLDALFALAGREVRLNVPLPWAGKVDGELALEDGALRAELELRTPRSSLTVSARGQREGPVIDEARVEGVVSWADLLPEEARARVDLDESAPLTLEGHAHGALDALEGALRLDSPRVVADFLARPAALGVDVALGRRTTARARLAVDGAGEWTAALEVDEDGALAGALGGAIDAQAIAGPEVTLAGAPIALSGAIAGTLRAPSLGATLAAPRLTVARAGAEATVEEVEATARLDGARVRARIGAGVATVTLARGADPQIEVQHLDAPAALSLLVLAGAGESFRLASDDARETLFALPDDLLVELRGALGPERFEATVELATPRSRLHLAPLAVARADGALDGSALTGTLAAADALDVGLFPGPVHVDRAGTAQLDARLVGAGADAALEGRVTTASLGWCFRARPDLPPIVLSAAATGLRVDGEALTLTGLEGNVFGGRGRMDLRVTYDGRTPTGEVTVEDASQGLGAWVAAGIFSDRPLAGLRGDLALASNDTGALVGPLRLRTPSSSLDVSVVIAPDNQVDGTHAVGALALGDLYELIPRGGPTLVGKGTLHVDAALEGPFSEPSAALGIHADALTLLVAGAGFKGLKVRLDRALARMHVSMDRVVWRELTLHGYEGKVRSQGLFGWGDGFRGFQAKLEVDDVAVGQLPQPGGGALGEHLGGRLNASLSITKKGDAKLSGKGDAWIDEPRYPMLRLSRQGLAKVGLEPPSPRGTEPLMVALRGGPEGWLLKGLSGAVHGARCDGDLVLRRDGTIFGRLELVVEAVYLRTSTLLNLPAAALGDVRIPLTVTGHAAQPDFEADVLAAFDHLVAKTRVGRTIHRAVDRVMDRLGAGGRWLEGDATGGAGLDAASLDTEALIHRIAAGDADEDVYLDVLIDRGLSPDEIATRIERARED